MRWNISAACLAAWSGLVVFSLLLPAQAQVNLTGGTMTPAVGPYDQSYLPGAVVEGTDTIGSPFGAYSGSASWQNNGTYYLVNNGDKFAVRIGVLSGTSYAVILETNAVYTGSSINTGGTGSALGTYFTFDLSELGMQVEM